MYLFLFLFLILLISHWVVAASCMAEKPNVHGSGNRCRRYICVVSGRMGLLPLSVCSLVRCGSHQCIFPCRCVVLGHSSTLCDQPRKAFTGHRVDVDILHISYADIFIV